MSVLVFAENWEGRFKKSTFEAVSYASEIARQLGTTTTVISIGNTADEDMKSLGKYGATKVLSVKGDKFASFEPGVYTSIIAEAAKASQAQVVVVSYTYSGKAIAPRLAVRLKGGLVSGATALPSNLNPFTVRKKCFSGKGLTDVVVNTAVKVIAISPNSYQVNTGTGEAAVEAFSPAVNDADFKIVSKELKKTSGKIALTEAEIVVSAGRGLKGPENWGMVEQLAELLGAATACSKPVADIGWRPHHEHVGQTGITIAPNLYIAIGISGAIQHLAGVSSSKVIVVVNSDAEAPFFKAADYGIVGDAFQVVPQLIEAVKKLKAAHN
ncbi:MAG TPA: electron transfer flavoprotein subunit alpha/FixB family protein [Bacteroidia bacterium]|jgi:electron transfer flavoprotein alpha subunit|nr:electron transfer flavoprotein subunit alpha/FixB family protein [Bacteroidia bacterium]